MFLNCSRFLVKKITLFLIFPPKNEIIRIAFPLAFVLIYLHLPLVVEVNCINNFFFSIFDYLPYCSTYHMTSWQRCDRQAMSFTYVNKITTVLRFLFTTLKKGYLFLAIFKQVTYAMIQNSKVKRHTVKCESHPPVPQLPHSFMQALLSFYYIFLQIYLC